MSDRVAIYARVSTDEQAERQTIESQLHACREYAARQEWEVVAEFRDEGVSGSTPLEERTEGQRLLTAAQDDAFERVLVYRLDRLSRDTIGCLLAWKRLEALKAPPVSVDETFDDSPSGRFAMTVMSAVAELEKNLIRQRTMDGRYRSVRNGSYMASKVPYGYARHKEGLKADRQQARVIRSMFQWAKDGLGIQAIAHRLDERGVKPPDTSKKRSAWGWHPTTVYKLLTSPRYIGQATYGGQPMECPALVDEETFDLVRSTLRQHRVDSPRNTKHFYLLQHLIWCGHCGSRYMAKMTGSGAVYLCRQRTVYGAKAGHEHVKWRWQAKELEEPVKALVRKFAEDPKRAAQHLQVYVAELEQRAAQEEDLRGPLEEEVADLAEQELKVLDWARRGLITDSQMVEQLNEVRANQREVKAKLQALSIEDNELSQREVLTLLREGWAEITGLLAQLGERASEEGVEVKLKWREFTDEEWRYAVRYFVNKLVVEDDRTFTVEGPLGKLAEDGISGFLPS